MATTFNIQIGALPFAIIKDEKAEGEGGGSCVAGWQRRDLNSIYSTIGGLVLSSNQFKLPPGTYLIQAKAPAYKSHPHKITVYNVDTGSHDIIGTSAYAHAPGDVANFSAVDGVVSITSETTFEIRHYTEQASLNSGLGVAASAGVAEVYTTVYIIKLN